MYPYVVTPGVVKMAIFSRINNKKGISLVFVVLVMLVLSILSVAVFTLFTSNMRQAQLQENHIRAHYVAISGVDVTFSAIMQGTASNRLLNTYFNKPISTTVNPLTDSLSLDGGDVEVTVSSYIESGNRWILITSTGTLTDGSGVSRTVQMRFRVEYPEIQQWN